MKNLEQMTIEELEEFRAGKQADIEQAQREFMEAGKILQQKLNLSELQEQKATLAGRLAELDEKMEALNG